MQPIGTQHGIRESTLASGGLGLPPSLATYQPWDLDKLLNPWSLVFSSVKRGGDAFPKELIRDHIRQYAWGAWYPKGTQNIVTRWQCLWNDVALQHNACTLMLFFQTSLPVQISWTAGPPKQLPAGHLHPKFTISKTNILVPITGSASLPNDECRSYPRPLFLHHSLSVHSAFLTLPGIYCPCPLFLTCPTWWQNSSVPVCLTPV